jgi:hypothetical protein
VPIGRTRVGLVSIEVKSSEKCYQTCGISGLVSNSRGPETHGRDNAASYSDP